MGLSTSSGVGKPFRAVSPEERPQYLWKRAILTLFFLVTLLTLTCVAPEFSHYSGSSFFFHMREEP